MTLGRHLLVFPILLALAAFSPPRADAQHGVRVTEYPQGRALCLVRPITLGDAVIRGGHCYILAVVRDSESAFLGFVDPGQKIPPGRLVRLDTPEGTRLRAHILYLVPMPPQAFGQMLLIPPNTLQLVRLRQEDEVVEDSASNPQAGFAYTHVVSSRLTLIITNVPPPEMNVTFVVHF